MKYHEYPKEWIKRGNEITGQIESVLGLGPYCTVTARLASRGGWRVGYTTTGNIVVTVKWPTGTDPKYMNGEAVYRGKFDLKKIQKWWNRNKGSYDFERERVRILCLYRQSGLIPQRVVKSHQTKIKGKFGRYNKIKEAWTFLDKMSTRYIERHAVCPRCNRKGNFQLDLCGWTCEVCKDTWADINPWKCIWETI